MNMHKKSNLPTLNSPELFCFPWTSQWCQ